MDADGTQIDWESRFRSTMESLRDPLLIMSSVRDESGEVVDLRYEYVNGPALANIGIPEAELIGSNMLKLLPSHLELGLFETYRNVVLTGERLVLEVPWFEEGNIVGAWEVSATKLGDGFVAITRDVTERTLATKRLAERERRFRMLADHAAEVAVLATDGVIQWISPSVTDMLAWAPDEIIGRHDAEFIHPDDLPRVEAVRAEVHHRGVGRVRFRVIHHDGGWRWVDGISRLANEDEFQAEADRAVVTVMWDVQAEVELVASLASAEAERQKLEARVQQAERMQSLGVLAGGIAHDFNNMLAAVLGNAELARAMLDEQSPAARLVEEVMLAAERAAELTRQMLAYAGRRGLDQRAVRLEEVVADTLQLVSAVVAKTVSISVDIPADLPPVFADPSQLQQLFMNLMINAADSMEGRRGEVTIRGGCDEIDAERAARLSSRPLQPGMFVVLEVTDTGCGMSADTLKHAFEPFFSTKRTGRGLGLSVAHGVVRSMGGMIQVASEQGMGTSISVYLPPTEPSPPATEIAANDAADRRPERRTILVVDDEPSLLATVREGLELAGHEVVSACDGEQAVEIFRSAPERFSAAIVDLTLPGMSGHQVIAELLRFRPDLRVVLMSGYDATDARDARDQAADVRFIQKPFRLKALLDAVAEANGSDLP